MRIDHLGRQLLIVGLALAVAGCVTTGQIAEEVARSRREAFHCWREAEQDTRPLVKGKLGLRAAQLLAVGNNKQLLAILKEKEVAEGKITEAWADALPNLRLEATYSRLDEVPSFSAGPAKVTVGDENNYSLALTLAQPIFRGGAIGAGIRAAKIYSLLADEQVRGVLQQVLYEARKAYYDVLLARELVEVSEEDLARVRRHLADVEKKQRAGTATDFDVLRARVEVSNVEAELIERRNAFHLAKTALLKTLGVSQKSQVELSDHLVYRPEEVELAAAVEKALRDRPELRQGELSVRLRREALVAARSGWWPSIDAFVTENYAYPDPHSMTNLEWGDAWTAGLKASWAIFDAGRTAGRVRQEKARLEEERLKLLEAEEFVLLDVQQAILNIQDAEQFVRSQSANLERAREGLRLAEAGYRQGVTTEVEVLDARQALSRTQALYYQALHKHMLARLMLERATGALVPPAKEQEP